jgi:uncharacterized protein (TIGR02145 family)
MKNLATGLLALMLAVSCQKQMPLPINEDDQSILNAGGRAGGPTVTTANTTVITNQSATSGGTVSSSGGGSQVSERGVCYSTSPNPTTANNKVISGSGAGTFVSIIYGLAGNTTYYVKAYAIKSGTTYYGSQKTFTTYATPANVTDIDGNVYNTINIGGQIWTMQNLKTTKYRNGVSIPAVSDDTAWAALTTGAYCNYNNDASNVATYGRLYNWHAATDANGLAPEGFHVPSAAEWDVLRDYLGFSTAGGSAKEMGLTHWKSPNTGATNSCGFTALPGSARLMCLLTSCTSPAFFSGQLTDFGAWWSTTASSSTDAQFRQCDYNDTDLYRNSFLGGAGYYDKRTGYSIRCVKN